MKKFFKPVLFVFVLLISLSGCSYGHIDSENDLPKEVINSPLTNEFLKLEDYPSKIEYDKLWYYSGHGESEDPEFIKEVVDLILTFKVGEKVDIRVTDFTDLVRFVYDDDNTILLNFEEYNIVLKDGIYKVDGDLSKLRELLGTLLD